MRLNKVVLPAPFGPMTPTMRPSGTVSDMSVRARMPPKFLLTLRSVSTVMTAFPAG